MGWTPLLATDTPRPRGCRSGAVLGKHELVTHIRETRIFATFRGAFSARNRTVRVISMSAGQVPARGALVASALHGGRPGGASRLLRQAVFRGSGAYWGAWSRLCGAPSLVSGAILPAFYPLPLCGGDRITTLSAKHGKIHLLALLCGKN